MDIHHNHGPHIPQPLEQRYASLAARRRTFSQLWPQHDQSEFHEHALWGFYCLPSPLGSTAPTIRCFYCGVLLGMVRRILLPQTHLRNCLYYLAVDRRPSVSRQLVSLVPRYSDVSLAELRRTDAAMAAAQLRAQQRRRNVALLLDDSDSSSSSSSPPSPPTLGEYPLFANHPAEPDAYSLILVAPSRRTVLMEPWSPLTNSVLHAALYATARTAHSHQQQNHHHSHHHQHHHSRPRHARPSLSTRRQPSREYAAASNLPSSVLTFTFSVADSTRLGARRNAISPILLGQDMDQVVISAVDRLLEQYAEYENAAASSSASTSSPPLLVAGQALCQPKHDNQSLYENRLATFALWPPSISVSGHQLAAAGFFYSNANDSVTCFHCGSSARAWASNDDPWLRHARISVHVDASQPNLPQDAPVDCCPFVYMVKGGAFVREARQPIEQTTRDRSISPDPAHERDDKAVCIVCCIESPAVMFAPCGHLVACYKCALGRDKCFVCRQKITALHKVFYA
jgi:baculoviral IAP repeat-containing protein 7/8